MLNGHSKRDAYETDKFDEFFSMKELSVRDKGKYLVTYLPGSDLLYQLKADRPIQIMEMMATYRKQGLFCDVSLCVNGERYHAHKLVLSSTSTYFASMFCQSGHIESTTKEIDLTKTIPCPTALSAIIDFLYTSRIQLNDKCVLPVLTCAMEIVLEELIDLCIDYLEEQLHASNCIGLLLYAKQYNCNPLITAAQNFICEHFEDVVRHEEFLTLPLGDIYAMLQNDNVKVKCESIIYNAAMQWFRHDPANRRGELQEILPCIRLELIDLSFLADIINQDEFSEPDMVRCREYLTTAYENLKSHRYCHLPPHRAPIKPLVIYCAGGYYNRSIGTMECYYLETQQWKRCADLQIPRSGVGVVSLYMRVYVIGGRHNIRNENRDCSEVERYDPFVNRWATIAPMNEARNRLGVGAIDTYIYAVGGSCGQKIFASVERLSVLTDTESWHNVAPMHIARTGLAVCTHARLLYAIGGFDGRHRLADVEFYNPDANKWTPINPLLIGRSGAAAAPLAECIYVVGGYATDDKGASMQLDAVEQYNTYTGQWTFVRSMNFRRSALSCATLDNRLFAFGGYDGNNFSSVVEIYDPGKNEWLPGSPLTQERSGHGSAFTVEPSLDNDE